jgi:hypothetical protein
MEDCDWMEENMDESYSHASWADGATEDEEPAVGMCQETTEYSEAIHASDAGHDSLEHTVNSADVAQQDAVNSLLGLGERRWFARRTGTPIGLKKPVTARQTLGNPTYKTQIEQAIRIVREAKRGFVHGGEMSSESLGCLPCISVKGVGRMGLPLCAQQAGQ